MNLQVIITHGILKSCVVLAGHYTFMAEPPISPISGLVWSLYKCAVWWMAVYGTSATERALVLGLFVKRKEFLPGSGFPSRRDITRGV